MDGHLYLRDGSQKPTWGSGWFSSAQLSSAGAMTLISDITSQRILKGKCIFYLDFKIYYDVFSNKWKQSTLKKDDFSSLQKNPI